MSRLTIHNSDNSLDSINLMESKCILKFMPTFWVDANSPTINSNNGCTTISFNDGGNYQSIQTNNGIITININADKPTIIETEKATIHRGDFKITYDNYPGLNHTIVSCNNGMTVETFNNKVDITVFGNRIEFESRNNSTLVITGSEVIIDNFENPGTELVLGDEFNCNSSPIKLDNQSSWYLETIYVNTDTIFNNFCIGNKAGSINISQGKKFEQTENDLFINKLNLDSEGEIKFTYNGNSYKFINPQSNPAINNISLINDLYNFVEEAKNFKTTADYLRNWSGNHDYHLMASFVLQNQGCNDIPPPLGDNVVACDE